MIEKFWGRVLCWKDKASRLTGVKFSGEWADWFWSGKGKERCCGKVIRKGDRNLPEEKNFEKSGGKMSCGMKVKIKNS